MNSLMIFSQGAAGGNNMAAIAVQMAPLLLIFVVFYFLLIRPQQRRAKDHADTIQAVKRGDSVVTGGGILGKVTKVDDVEVEVEIATGVKIKVVKATLADVLPKGGKPAND